MRCEERSGFVRDDEEKHCHAAETRWQPGSWLDSPLKRSNLQRPRNKGTLSEVLDKALLENVRLCGVRTVSCSGVDGFLGLRAWQRVRTAIETTALVSSVSMLAKHELNV